MDFSDIALYGLLTIIVVIQSYAEYREKKKEKKMYRRINPDSLIEPYEDYYNPAKNFTLRLFFKPNYDEAVNIIEQQNVIDVGVMNEENGMMYVIFKSNIK